MNLRKEENQRQDAVTKILKLCVFENKKIWLQLLFLHLFHSIKGQAGCFATVGGHGDGLRKR